tara:strand:- start:450 stop:1484 length:1035 start_codon:yes stop_codon:yes gene_type:complete
MNNFSLQINLGIYFEVSKDIGMGHFHRCLNLSNLINSQKSYFFYLNSNDISINTKIEKLTNKNNIILNKIDDKNELINLTTNIKFDLFIIDSFFENYQLETQIKENVNKLLIWDHYPYRKHNCDYILDHTINFLEDYHYKNLNKGCKIIYGTDKVILNKEFYKTNIINKTGLKNVLVMMGGTDVNNDTLIILKSLLNLNKLLSDDLVFKIIITDSYEKKDDIINFCSKYKNMEILENVNNNLIPNILNNTDLLINTAGMSNYEALYFGIPSITIFTRKIHYEHLNDLVERKAIFIIKKINYIYEFNNIINNIKIDYNNIHKRLLNIIPKKNNIKNILLEIIMES